MSRENRRLRLFVKHYVNPVLGRLARLPGGPFALLTHIGRRSGKQFETPIMAFRNHEGFVIVLTYGQQVDWLRNIQATGEGRLRWHGHTYRLSQPRLVGASEALPALPPIRRFIIQRGKVHEFVQFTSQPLA